jgi:hypothetical protein
MDKRQETGTAVAAAATTAAPATGVAAAGPAGEPAARDIRYHGFRGRTQLATGTLAGAAVTDDTVVIATPAGVRSYTDPHTGVTVAYEYATWTSPVISPGFAATQVIPSWTADTPTGCWVQIELAGTTTAGTTTGWYDLGHWAGDDSGIPRTSVPGQRDEDGHVAVDTFVAAAGRALIDCRLRVTLLRPVGAAATPVLRSVGAVASRLPEPGEVAPSRPQAARGIVLDVPRYSQRVHDGHYPQWDGGGKSCCSPASTSMLLAFWGTGPTPAEYAWVDPGDPNPRVDHAARHCYDYAYGGCGNWPFNTAYAGLFGLDSFVTWLRSLNEAELFIAAGIPLIVSASYREGQVPGLDYSTDGHLMVLVGFTEQGDPVLNDPAADSDDRVRKVVGRAEFEAAWLNSSRGLAYVIRPPSAPLPPAPAQPNW